MLRKLRSSIVAAGVAAGYVLPVLWTKWGVGGVLSLATLAWMVLPGGERPEVPRQLATAAELRPQDAKAAAPPSRPPSPEASGPTTLPVAKAGPTTAPASWLVLGPPKPGPTTAPVPGEKEVFRQTFFEPDAEGLDPRYSHRVDLTPSQVRHVIGRIEVLEEKGNEFGLAHRDYVELDEWITQPDVEKAFFHRIKSGQGFRYPDLAELWSRYADNAGPELHLPAYVQQGYFTLRIRNIKTAVVRGRVTEGDLKFLDNAIEYLDELLVGVREKHENAKRLQRHLSVEGILVGENPKIRARRREAEAMLREFGIEPSKDEDGR